MSERPFRKGVNLNNIEKDLDDNVNDEHPVTVGVFTNAPIPVRKTEYEITMQWLYNRMMNRCCFIGATHIVVVMEKKGES